MRRMIALGWALVVAGGLAMPAAAADVVIGSSSVGGSYYLYAGGLATYLTKNAKGVQVTARTTRGSVENARLLDRKAMDFAFINATVLYQQRHGVEQFKGQASRSLRGVALVDLAPTHWVTLRDANIQGFDDLKGKRVSIGAAGSGGANTATMVLRTLGLLGQVRVQQLGFEESATNLRDGNLEAFAAGSALPMPAVADLATTKSLRLLSIGPDVIKKLQQEDPAIEMTTIPPGTYRGVDTPTTTIGTPSTLVAHSGVPDDVVYEVARHLLTPATRAYMKTIYHAWDASPGGELWSRIEVPLHPGAARAYKEAGLLK
ncbi:MAG: TAXI family TRAP transporter solute-binding subunit [Candidatus Rokuibacteriota bacterium]